MTPLYGLVLAGGESSRMGEDKALLSYHGSAQWKRCSGALAGLCQKVFLSCRKDQETRWQVDLPVMVDEYPCGPATGILSAHAQYPEVSWLVLACDLPWCERRDLEYLVSHRDSRFLATAYCDPQTRLPEPLLAIWEAEGLARFRKAQSLSPRAFLSQSPCRLLEPICPQVVRSINTQEEYREFLRQPLGAAARVPLPTA